MEQDSQEYDEQKLFNKCYLWATVVLISSLLLLIGLVFSYTIVIAVALLSLITSGIVCGILSRRIRDLLMNLDSKMVYLKKEIKENEDFISRTKKEIRMEEKRKQ